MADGDRLALEEFHSNRTVFRYPHRPPLLFTEFLDMLRQANAKSDGLSWEVATWAYDHCLDKFLNSPNKELKSPGPDCRLYLLACLHCVEDSLSKEPPADPLEEEVLVAKRLQGFVRRQFYLSCLEAKRRLEHFWSRYCWRLNGERIHLWLPAQLKGRSRGLWLETHVDDPDPQRNGERARIQEIVNKHFMRERLVPLSEADNIIEAWQDPESGEGFCNSLSSAVAEEKAGNIHHQRRAIQAIGSHGLRALVLRIFEDLRSDDFNAAAVAKEFSLSKATLSRFAGTEWHDKGTSIPDLWQNTAQVLAANPVFREVAEETGIWGAVNTTLKRAERA
jgi:hypothetical protein